MRRFFTRIERPADMQLLFEPRGKAWTPEIVRPLIGELDVVHVVDPFVGPTTSVDLTYYRLHGITGARHVYSLEEPSKLVAMVPGDRDANVMFDNMPRVGGAERFKLLLARAKAAA